jgi:hypothetical protein
MSKGENVVEQPLSDQLTRTDGQSESGMRFSRPQYKADPRASLDGGTVAPKKTFDFEASRPTIWHSFIFKVSDRPENSAGYADQSSMVGVKTSDR